MTHGSCLCGAVRYEITGSHKWIAHCHCSMCRKHHGTFYSTGVGVDPKNFRLLQGADAIARYRSSAAVERPFCRHCGSSLPDPSAETLVVCPAGALDDDFQARPSVHIFVGSKSPMCEITDQLRQFEEYPPGAGTAVAGPSPTLKENVVQGSCLCGAVAFEIDTPPQHLVNCHCSRCRRNRGTAHGTNFFTRKEKLRWMRGEERVTTYKVPDAKLFSASFCDRCGSSMPSMFDAMSMYNVPIGSIDTPLAARPSAHIYVGSKSTWFDITDSLPQFVEMPPRERFREFFV